MSLVFFSFPEVHAFPERKAAVALEFSLQGKGSGKI
jgi:hypothetical protein